MNTKYINSAIYISAALFIISLCLPALITDNSYSEEPPQLHTYLGWQVLALGWLAIFDWSIAWYANVLLLISIVLSKFRRRSAIYTSVIGLLMALSSLLYRQIWGDGGPPEVIIEYGLGFYVWLSSFASILFASIASNK